MDPINPFEALGLALREADKGAGFVAPNPLVGCAILSADFQLLAVGYHSAVGLAHAEAEAISKVNPKDLAGAHVFVTLEPCAHQGRTPSCAKALARLPVASVTYGLRDPYPLVAGEGAKILRAAGKAVLDLSQVQIEEVHDFFSRFHLPDAFFSPMTAERLLELQWEMEEVAEIFLHTVRAQLPFVALKMASSLDGQIALSSGESQWITQAPARDEVHRLRARFDAILVGRRTVEFDNPSLDIRHEAFPGHPNRVVVIDPQAQTLKHLATSKLWQTHKPDEIFMIVDLETPVSPLPFPQQNWIAVPRLEDKSLDLRMALQKLFSHRLTSVFVEGGSHTYAQLLRQRLVQRLFLFQAPVILGAGLSWSQGLSFSRMTERLELSHVKIKPLGRDWLITGRLS